jgi:predicted dehydrogenase
MDQSLKAYVESGEISVAWEAQFGELHKRLVDDFARCLRTGDSFRVSGEEGYRSLELIKSIYRSAESRFFVSLPLEVLRD